VVTNVLVLSSMLVLYHDSLDSLDADNDDDDDGPGLFDSDDEDDAPAKKPLSKRERMEALTAKKRQVTKGASGSSSDKKSGYDSGDSYNSSEYVRTKEDDDFIDTEGDDKEALSELYSEQIFDDERGEADEEHQKKKKIKGVGSSSRRSELAELEAEGDQDNPMMQAVNKMKKKKRVTKHFSQLAEEDAKPLIARMEQAADDDDEAISQKRPATKKLSMLNEVCEKLASKELMRPLLEHDLLSLCKRWIQPLPNGTLGNVTVRNRLLHSISLMTGENGISKDDLRASEFGKVVMSLYMHKNETPGMKRQLKALIDQWSRPIFQKSGNMRDLERVHQSRGATGLAGMARINQAGAQKHNASLNLKSTHRGGKDQDIDSLIKSGSMGKTESGINRVRIPYSKGFHYTARPTNKSAGIVDKRRQQGGGRENRLALSKRILDKKRPKGKNQRSANISIEGRVTKP
jgi:transcription factor SPN1